MKGETMRERFEKIASTFYGGAPSDNITSVTLTKLGVKESMARILAFIESEIALEQERIEQSYIVVDGLQLCSKCRTMENISSGTICARCMTESYNRRDHTHCFDQENPPCGIRGKHRCCLCEAKGHTSN